MLNDRTCFHPLLIFAYVILLALSNTAFSKDEKKMSSVQPQIKLVNTLSAPATSLSYSGYNLEKGGNSVIGVERDGTVNCIFTKHARVISNAVAWKSTINIDKLTAAKMIDDFQRKSSVLRTKVWKGSSQPGMELIDMNFILAYSDTSIREYTSFSFREVPTELTEIFESLKAIYKRAKSASSTITR